MRLSGGVQRIVQGLTQVGTERFVLADEAEAAVLEKRAFAVSGFIEDIVGQDEIAGLVSGVDDTGAGPGKDPLHAAGLERINIGAVIDKRRGQGIVAFSMTRKKKKVLCRRGETVQWGAVAKRRLDHPCSLLPAERSFRKQMVGAAAPDDRNTDRLVIAALAHLCLPSRINRDTIQCRRRNSPPIRAPSASLPR